MTDYKFGVPLDLEVQFGFGEGPLDVPGPGLVDLADRLLSVTTFRGRQSVRAHFDAGTAVLLLDNSDGDLDPFNSSSPYFGDMNIGTPVVIQAQWESATWPIFFGTVTRWPLSYPLEGFDAVVQIELTEQLAVLNKYLISASYPQQTADERIDAILDDVGWPFARFIDPAGATPLAAVDFEGVALDAILAAADADQGAVWIARGGGLAYTDRLHFSGATSEATFDPTGAGLPYTELGELSYDDDFLINQAVITAGDGGVGTASDATSLATHGPGLPFEQTLEPLLTAVYAEGVAQWLVGKYKDVAPRVTQLSIPPELDPADLFDEVLGRDLQDLITVVIDPPGGGDELTQLVSVEGVQHVVTTDTWHTVYLCHPVSAQELEDDYWILGVSDDLGQDTRLA